MRYHDILWHSHDSWHIMTKGIQWLSLMTYFCADVGRSYAELHAHIAWDFSGPVRDCNNILHPARWGCQHLFSGLDRTGIHHWVPSDWGAQASPRSGATWRTTGPGAPLPLFNTREGDRRGAHTDPQLGRGAHHQCCSRWPPDRRPGAERSALQVHTHLGWAIPTKNWYLNCINFWHSL